MKADSNFILNVKSYEELFSPNLDDAKAEYKKLSRIWHPDVRQNSEESKLVMQKLNELYTDATKALQAGQWGEKKKIVFVDLDKKEHKNIYFNESDIELGKAYHSKLKSIYIISKRYRDLIQERSGAFKAVMPTRSRYLTKIVSSLKEVYDIENGDILLALKNRGTAHSTEELIDILNIIFSVM